MGNIKSLIVLLDTTFISKLMRRLFTMQVCKCYNMIMVLVVIILVLCQSLLFSEDKNFYECNFTSDSIAIDGVLDESVWQKAKVINFVIPVTHQHPESITEGKLLWDEKCLYVGLKAFDKDIIGTFTERDSTTYKDDVLEIFIKPGTDDSYYNFEINVLGTFYDAFNKRGMDDLERLRWNCKDLKIGIKKEGTLNDSSDKDEYWQMEVAIPFDSLQTLKGVPEKDDVWLFHLCRYDYSVYLPKGKELSSCALLSKRNFHYYKDWMKLRFIK